MKAQTIQIDSTFTSDGEIFPFSSNDTIYGLSISGSVTLNSDTSLVRVILTDNSGNTWMVFEAYPMINPVWTFPFNEMADETTRVGGVAESGVRDCQLSIVNCRGDLQLMIYDVFGREVDEIKVPDGQNTIKINVESYPPGVYIVILKKGFDLLESSKFVIAR